MSALDDTGGSHEPPDESEKTGRTTGASAGTGRTTGASAGTGRTTVPTPRLRVTHGSLPDMIPGEQRVRWSVVS